jgi:large subunit ribosomal protein L20
VRPSRAAQLKYSQLIHGLAAENIVINRKALSELAQNEPQSFKALVDVARRQKDALAAAQWLRQQQLQ